MGLRDSHAERRGSALCYFGNVGGDSPPPPGGDASEQESKRQQAIP